MAKQELLAQSKVLLGQAVEFDKNQRHDLALFSYNEAVECLLKANALEPLPALVLAKLNQYITRAEQLKQIVDSERKQEAQLHHTQSIDEAEADRAKFLLNQALEADEADNYNEAIDLYMGAVQLCLEKRKTVSTDNLRNDLALIAEKALSRAEFLKEKIHAPVDSDRLPSYDTATQSLPALGAKHQTRLSPVGDRHNTSTTVNTVPAASSPNVPTTPNPNGNAPASKSGKSHMNTGSETYTKSELAVLRKTSTINGREYVPFLNVDLNERFAYPIPFTDKDGKVALAPKQKTSFAGWVRPSDLSSDPKMIESIDCFAIKQSVVSDCSFVASLAISALYEKRFKKRLISSIIYPQNRNGDPIYNPSGKYMIKFHINGVPRKVIIDDFLPASKYGELLISYSVRQGEFWVSLLEKAYMKVMGGYDFPGSNSNIDLNVLTGWIPERISLHSKTPHTEFNPEKAFQKMFERFHRGDVLITVATGEMSDADADRAGLVSCHAYAVLDIRQVLGKNLFLLKNPWRNLRWRGNFSERDVHSWTPQMKTALAYDPKSAAQFDNGVFWIDYESILHFFDVFYLNWNPDLFHYTFCFHDEWIHGSGPRRDMYDVSNNPQYLLTVNAPANTTSAAVWILLTRHITDREDFANNRQFITLVVYKNNGRRIYYPFDPLPFIDGVRINSPHYLCRIWLPNFAGKTDKFTLVVSEYEKTTHIYFTLRCYATIPFTLQKLTLNFQHKFELKTGMWTAGTAGGCPNHTGTYQSNPKHKVILKSSLPGNRLLIQLKGPKEYNVGFELKLIESYCSDATKPAKEQWLTDPFRPGFVVLDLENVGGGVYHLIPSTFHPGQCGPYFIALYATSPVTLESL